MTSQTIKKSNTDITDKLHVQYHTLNILQINVTFSILYIIYVNPAAGSVIKCIFISTNLYLCDFYSVHQWSRFK